MLFEKETILVLTRFKGDPQAAFERSVRAVIELRKSEYDRFPHRLCVDEALINAYLTRDAAGFTTEIEAALDDMARHADPSFECYQCYLGLHAKFFYNLRRYAEAREMYLRGLEPAQAIANPRGRADRLQYLYANLCRVAQQLRDWPEVLTWSKAALEVAPEGSGEFAHQIPELRVRQACALRWQGDPGAHAVFLQATAEAATMQDRPMGMYLNVVGIYHELGGEMDQALRAWERLAEHWLIRKVPSGEAEARLRICQLLAQLGRPYHAERAAARAVAAKLHHPEEFLRKLDQLKPEASASGG